MEALIVVAVALLGAILGSFIGVIAERISTGQSWARGRSKCNSCNRELGAHDLIPVVSWLVSGGRCFTCKSRVPIGYMVLEATLGGVFALTYLMLGFSLALLVAYAFLSVLAFIVVYDLRHTIVPPQASLLLSVLGLAFAFLSESDIISFGGVLFTAGVIGGAFVLLHVCSKGRAMGLGDAPVAFALALFVGSGAVTGLLFSFWIGALCGIAILFMQRGGPRMGIEVPFVPFLAAGFLLAYYTGWNLLLF